MTNIVASPALAQVAVVNIPRAQIKTDAIAILEAVSSSKKRTTIRDAIFVYSEKNDLNYHYLPREYSRLYREIVANVRFYTVTSRGAPVPTGPYNKLLGKYLFVEKASKAGWQGGTPAACSIHDVPTGKDLPAYVEFQRAFNIASATGANVKSCDYTEKQLAKKFKGTPEDIADWLERDTLSMRVLHSSNTNAVALQSQVNNLEARLLALETSQAFAVAAPVAKASAA